ncbi:MAG: hypothetical protein ACI7YS_10980 [Flavobacterium sp.]
MINTSKYRDKIFYFIDFKSDVEGLINWISCQPDLEQPDILREIRNIYIEKYEKTGETTWLEQAKNIEDGVDEFEEEILDEKLRDNLFSAELDHALKDVEWTPNNIKIIATVVRESLIKNYFSDPERDCNMKLWNAIHLAVTFEKNKGIYDENNWSTILKNR